MPAPPASQRDAAPSQKPHMSPRNLHFRAFLLVAVSLTIPSLYIARQQQFSSTLSSTFNPASFSSSDSFLRSYQIWHDAQRRCIRNNSCSPSLLIWQCPRHTASACAGLGDRVRGIQFALLLAVATRRVFLLDWPDDPFPIHIASQPSQIDWTMPAHLSRQEPDLLLDWYSCWKSLPCAFPNNHRFPSLSHLPMPRKNSSISAPSSLEMPPTVNILRHDLRTIWQPYKVIRIAERLDYRAIQALLDNERLQPHLGTLSEYSKLEVKRLLSQMLFRPSESVSERMYSFNLRQAPFIGVHVRSGDDFGETEHRFDNVKRNKITTTLQILRCVTSAFQNNSFPLKKTSQATHIYVASDSKTIKLLMARYAKQFNVHVHMLLGTAMHIAGNRKRRVKSRVTQRELFRNVFVDLFMLSKGAVLFSTGSGFSDTAWALSTSSHYYRIELDKHNPDSACKLKRLYER